MRKLTKKYKHWLHFSPPGALSARGWRLFKNEFREKAPIRFWLTNTGYQAFVLPVKWKYNDVRNWIRYRTRDRFHILDTGLSPTYYSVEVRMMHANFNLLKNFVEGELAWQTYIWSTEFKDRKDPWWTKLPLFNYFSQWFFPFKSREWAMKYFDWATKLDDPSIPVADRSETQASQAREILALYTWWVDVVPTRKLNPIPDLDSQGLGDLSILDSDFDHEADSYKRYEEVRKLNEVILEEWDKEDEEMLIRLVKIRKALWT